VGMNKCAGDAFAFNGRHMAGNTLASPAAGFVMSVLFKSRSARAVGR
jgi:hypothetical protein